MRYFTSSRQEYFIPDVRNQQNEVTSSSPAQTSLAGDTGASKGASWDAPDLHLESLAAFSDEGENGWNAQQRNDFARKMQRVAAGVENNFSLDEIQDMVGRAEQRALAEAKQ